MGMQLFGKNYTGNARDAFETRRSHLRFVCVCVCVFYFLRRKSVLVPGPRASQVEFHGFLTLIHDSIPRVVR